MPFTAQISNQVFRVWVSAQANVQQMQFTNATSCATNQIWTNWCTGTQTSATTSNVFSVWVAAQERIAETREQVERRKYVDQWNRFWGVLREAGIQASQALIKQRARRLLVETLSAAQRETYEKHGYFLVEVGERVYRIDQGTHGNVKELDPKTRKPAFSYCIQPNGVPAEDAMLAQKLQLETDEAGFRRIANRTAYYA